MVGQKKVFTATLAARPVWEFELFTSATSRDTLKIIFDVTPCHCGHSLCGGASVAVASNRRLRHARLYMVPMHRAQSEADQGEQSEVGVEVGGTR